VKEAWKKTLRKPEPETVEETKKEEKPIEQAPLIRTSTCQFFTWITKEQKVYCKSHWDKVRKWLPRNRLIEWETCESCRIKIAEPLLKWIREQEQKRSIKKATITVVRQEPSITVKEPEPERLKYDFGMNTKGRYSEDFNRGICLDFMRVKRENPALCFSCAKINQVRHDTCESMAEELDKSPLKMEEYLTLVPLAVARESHQQEYLKDAKVVRQEKDPIFNIMYDLFVTKCKNCEAYRECKAEYCTDYYTELRTKLSPEQLEQLHHEPKDKVWFIITNKERRLKTPQFRYDQMIDTMRPKTYEEYEKLGVKRGDHPIGTFKVEDCPFRNVAKYGDSPEVCEECKRVNSKDYAKCKGETL